MNSATECILPLYIRCTSVVYICVSKWLCIGADDHDLISRSPAVKYIACLFGAVPCAVGLVPVTLLFAISCISGLYTSRPDRTRPCDLLLSQSLVYRVVWRRYPELSILLGSLVSLLCGDWNWNCARAVGGDSITSPWPPTFLPTSTQYPNTS